MLSTAFLFGQKTNMIIMILQDINFRGVIYFRIVAD